MTAHFITPWLVGSIPEGSEEFLQITGPLPNLKRHAEFVAHARRICEEQTPELMRMLDEAGAVVTTGPGWFLFSPDPSVIPWIEAPKLWDALRLTPWNDAQTAH